MASKESEQKCFDYAANYLAKQKGIEKSIGLLLHGVQIKRQMDESPDFLFFSSKESSIIGVEHFEVDMMSNVSDKGVISFTNKFNKDYQNIFRKWHDIVTTSDEVPMDALNELFSSIAEEFAKGETSNYNTFLGSFNYSLEKHLKKVDSYISNIEKNNPNNFKQKFGFLIEIKTRFGEILTDNHSRYDSIKTGIPPLCNDIISILEDSFPKKIDFFVLVFRSFRNKNQKVYAFRSGKNVRKDLESLKIDIFNYIGEEKWLEMYNCEDSNCTPTVEKVDGGYNVVFKHSYRSLRPETKADVILQSVYAIQMCKKHGIKYAVTPLPFLIEQKCGFMISNWKIREDHFARPIVKLADKDSFIRELYNCFNHQKERLYEQI